MISLKGSVSLRSSVTLSISRRHISIERLVAAANSVKSEKKDVAEIRKAVDHRKVPVIKPEGLFLTPGHLQDRFRLDGIFKPSSEELHKSQVFFNNAKSKFEWSCAEYNDIPDIKYELLRNEKIKSLEDSGNDDSSEMLSKKTYGITPPLLKLLPEVLILGHTNVGKSSLINNLLVNKIENKSSSSATEHAYVSKKPGYTKTLNCFNVGNKIRIVDSPGYGRRGQISQGRIVVDYISKRQNLRKVLILIDSIGGLKQEDQQLIQFIVEQGVTFDVVFTKADLVVSKYAPKKLINKKHKFPDSGHENIQQQINEINNRIVKHYDTLISELGLYELSSLPTIYFNNACVNKYLPMRYGYKSIRHSILESCLFFSKIHLD